MHLHKLLSRQLKRLGLSDDFAALTPTKWQELLKKVSNTYQEVDQERYLNERSIDISSRELMDLNEKLENAQHIAQLGYWFYDLPMKKLTLSKELYHILGLDYRKPLPEFEQFVEMMHPEDREELIKLGKELLPGDVNYEKEIRLQRRNGKYHWYYVFGGTSHHSGVAKQISGIAMDITRRKETEEKVKLLNQQLLTAARQAGMADIATSVIHNIGNVLNSANVSLNILQENFSQPHFKKLIAAIELLKNHKDDISTYLTADQKGKIVPSYLIAICDILKAQEQTVCDEINHLNTYLQHIREIVGMQQEFSGVSGIVEKVFLPEIIDIALQMSGYSLFMKKIQVNKIYNNPIFVTVDKTKLLQILVNLIQNAKDAVIANQTESQKKIKFLLDEESTNSQVIIKVIDNGIGIEQENMVKIFSFGFTNKAKGHGVGLHTSALAAKELGGSLRAESEGIGSGATFTLTIPKTQTRTAKVSYGSDN